MTRSEGGGAGLAKFTVAGNAKRTVTIGISTISAKYSSRGVIHFFGVKALLSHGFLDMPIQASAPSLLFPS